MIDVKALMQVSDTCAHTKICTKCDFYSKYTGMCVFADMPIYWDQKAIAKALNQKLATWEYYKNHGIFDIYKCSVCGTPFNFPLDIVPSSVFRFCPHCGEAMQ